MDREWDYWFKNWEGMQTWAVKKFQTAAGPDREWYAFCVEAAQKNLERMRRASEKANLTRWHR